MFLFIQFHIGEFQYWQVGYQKISSTLCRRKLQYIYKIVLFKDMQIGYWKDDGTNYIVFWNLICVHEM